MHFDARFGKFIIGSIIVIVGTATLVFCVITIYNRHICTIVVIQDITFGCAAVDGFIAVPAAKNTFTGV